jgi:hypothetical protein
MRNWRLWFKPSKDPRQRRRDTISAGIAGGIGGGAGGFIVDRFDLGFLPESLMVGLIAGVICLIILLLLKVANA